MRYRSKLRAVRRLAHDVHIVLRRGKKHIESCYICTCVILLECDVVLAYKWDNRLALYSKYLDSSENLTVRH